jgi:DNA-binding response OmpR family regulator
MTVKILSRLEFLVGVNRSLERVLVIDDDKAMTDLLKMFLEQEMFEVITVDCGESGIKAACTHEPDVILLDLVLPDIDGWEVCKSLRQISQVPIILLSALNGPGLVSQAFDLGADEFLTKPVPVSVLVANIKRLTRRAKAEKVAPLRKGYRS